MQVRITDLERNLAALEEDLATTSKVVSPYTGRVLELKVYRGSAVSDGTPMVSIQPDARNLEALVYLSAVALDVKPGMAARPARHRAPRGIRFHDRQRCVRGGLSGNARAGP